MKKTSLLLFLILVIVFNTSSLGASLKFPEDTSLKQQGIVLTPANINLYFLGKPMNISSQPYYANGRLYLPLNDIVSFLGATMTKSTNNYNIFYNGKSLLLSAMVSENDSVKPLIYSNHKPYISFYTLNKALGLTPVFDTLNNVVDIYYDEGSPSINDKPLVTPSANAKAAYLRLEDIMADGEDPNAVYTDDGLEKLRIIGSYLHYRNQEYYIAWIPIYFNPKAKIYNDISTKYNLYNASFIYTLDHLIDNGGHIGIHGLTHQYNNEISAVGYEFDKNSPFNDTQMMSRMIQAKTIAKKLGYMPEFWEFPHYGATTNAFYIAEHYFDIVYQQSPYRADDGQIHIEQHLGKKTTYLPTPAEYVYNRYESKKALETIDKVIKQNKLFSIFMHPVLDFDRIEIKNNPDGSRTWHYPPYIIYPIIVDKAINSGYTFKKYS